MISRSGIVLSTPKRARSKPLYRLRLRGAEFDGKAVGSALENLGSRLQRLDCQAPHRAGDAERADHRASEVRHGNGDAADLEVELAIVKCNAAAPNVLDLASKRGDLGDRFLSGRLEIGARKKALEPVREAARLGSSCRARCNAQAGRRRHGPSTGTHRARSCARSLSRHRPCAPRNARSRRFRRAKSRRTGVATFTISISSRQLAASANSGRPTR